MCTECALFIDDSGFLIEAQKYCARYLNLRVPQDPRCRLDIGKLIDLAVQGRTVCYGKLYCSEPPALDTVWKKIREHLEVDTYMYQKSSKGQEKEVDTAMTLDVYDYALTSRSQARKKTIIIVARDRDYYTLVRKILSKEYAWKIELLTFERSMSNQMRDIKSDNFEVTAVESLFKEKKFMDSCCYVSARWRIDSYHLPRHRTIILHFKEQLSSPSGLLKKYANEITLITGIPCFYHLHISEPYTSLRVYIIGHTWVKLESVYSNEIHFFRICEAKKHELNTKCSEISPLYERYTTMMESGEDLLKLENRFSALATEDVAECSDDYFSSDIYDDMKVLEGREQVVFLNYR